eukprot:scaffold92780_cov33-Prasinocladus_malaysianus.AAC.2
MNPCQREIVLTTFIGPSILPRCGWTVIPSTRALLFLRHDLDGGAGGPAAFLPPGDGRRECPGEHPGHPADAVEQPGAGLRCGGILGHGPLHQSIWRTCK